METRVQPRSAEPAFHADDLEQVAEYRTVSALAIVSFVLGLASPLCFAAPLFLAIPLFGAAVSIVALRRIAVSDGALAGRLAAAAGLVLCVGCGAALISRDVVMRTIRVRQAEEFGRNWLALVTSGQTEPAFQLTSEASRPQAPPEPGMPAATTTPYDDFLKQPVIQALAMNGAGSNVRYAETLLYESPASRQFVIRQRFLVSPADAVTRKKESSPQNVVLTLQRSRERGQRNSRWIVASAEDPTASSDTSGQ